MFGQIPVFYKENNHKLIVQIKSWKDLKVQSNRPIRGIKGSNILKHTRQGNISITCIPRATHSKGVMKCLNDEETFNAPVPHYFLTGPRLFLFSLRMKTITRSWPQFQRLPRLIYAKQALGETVMSRPKAQSQDPTRYKSNKNGPTYKTNTCDTQGTLFWSLFLLHPSWILIYLGCWNANLVGQSLLHRTKSSSPPLWSTSIVHISIFVSMWNKCCFW